MPDTPLLTTIYLDSESRCADIAWKGGSQKYTGGGTMCPDDYANILNVISGIGKYGQPRTLVLGDQSYLIDNATEGKVV